MLPLNTTDANTRYRVTHYTTRKGSVSSLPIGSYRCLGQSIGAES